MHLISNERALAHWQALNNLPVLTLEKLKTRFLREQPNLVNTVLSLTDALVADAEGKYDLRDEEDPRMANFWKLVTTCAILNEILCREAGRSLHQLTADEAETVADETLDLLDQIKTVTPRESTDPPNIFTTSSQRHLLSGAVVARHTPVEPEQKGYFREIMTLRIVVEALHRACGDEPAATPRSWDAERIQFALASQGDPLRREALAACDAFRPALVTHFLKELERCATDSKAAVNEDTSLLTHAMFLLAFWREESAWPVFRKLFSLPGDVEYDLLGDLLTEDGAVLMAMAGAKRSDELRAMVEDESLDEFCRNECLYALTSLVLSDELPHAEQVAWLQGLLTGKLRSIFENGYVFAAVISSVCDLEAWELRPEVEAAYERGVVDDTVINLEDFMEAMNGAPGRQRHAFCERNPLITDVADRTRWLDEAPVEEALPEPLEPFEPFEPLEPLENLRVVADSAAPYHAPPKIGRNDPCSCGSGKKYKKCCGA